MFNVWFTCIHDLAEHRNTITTTITITAITITREDGMSNYYDSDTGSAADGDAFV
jgi:hypothetical protein